MGAGKKIKTRQPMYIKLLGWAESNIIAVLSGRYVWLWPEARHEQRTRQVYRLASTAIRENKVGAQCNLQPPHGGTGIIADSSTVVPSVSQSAMA